MKGGGLCLDRIVVLKAGDVARLTDAKSLFRQTVLITAVAGARYIRQKRAIEGEFIFAA